MKMLKDCELEVGDIILTRLNGEFEFIKYDSNNEDYPYRVINCRNRCNDGLSKNCGVYIIIKKDPKKKILEKIEEHKSEIKNLENQLKELNSLKVGEVYRVRETIKTSGILLHKNEYVFITYMGIDYFTISTKSGLYNIVKDLDSSKFEIINDPEMKNGLTKFFKGNSE